MKFSNTIKTVLKIYQKYVKNSVWFGTGLQVFENSSLEVSEERAIVATQAPELGQTVR